MQTEGVCDQSADEEDTGFRGNKVWKNWIQLSTTRLSCNVIKWRMRWTGHPARTGNKLNRPMTG